MSQESIGQRLRQAREAIPASLVEASRATRVRVDFLEAMERDSFTFISGRVYVVGMLRSYARWLRLDDNELAAEFDRIHGIPGPSPLLGESLSSRDEPKMLTAQPRKPPWAIIGAGAGLLIVVLLVVSFIRGGNNVAQPPSVPLSPSPSPTPSVTGTSSSPAPPAQGVALVVSVTKGSSSWLHVIAGNTVPALVVFQGTLGPGTTQTFTAPDLLRVDFANMGAVNLEVNGKSLGSPGPPGQNGAFAIRPDATISPDPSASASPPPVSRPPPSHLPSSPSPSPAVPSPSPSARPSPSPPVTPPPVSPAAPPPVAPGGSPSP
jgi:hypothetical protein